MSERTIIVKIEATKVINNKCFEMDKSKLEELLIFNIKEVLGSVENIHVEIQEQPEGQSVIPKEFEEQTMNRFERVE